MANEEYMEMTQRVEEVLKAIVKIKEGMNELNEAYEGITPAEVEELNGFYQWKSLRDFESNVVVFNEEVFDEQK